MSYLVLARKWRPQTFEDVVGQEHVTRTLQNAIKSGRVAHAYLFTGARGVGKTSAARILAKALNCIDGPTPLPCNTCESCKEITAGASMDVFEIDGASNTGVDDIRELRENIKFPPIKGRYRIYIIDEVHMLSTSAFNALLKTLEEPPPHVVFVFATTEVQKIPITILSRCQEFDFKRIPAIVIQERLKAIAASEGINISDRGLHIIAREADGGMRDAQSILDQVISFAGEDVSDDDIAKILGVVDRQVLKDVAQSIIERNPGGCVKVVERVYDHGYDIRVFCRNLLEYLRNLTVLKIIKDAGRLIDLPESEIEELKRLSDGFTQDELQQLFAILTKGEDELKRTSSPRLSLEMTLMKMSALRPLSPISDLIDKVTLLESKIGGLASGGGKQHTTEALNQKVERLNSGHEARQQAVHDASDIKKDGITGTPIEMEELGDVWSGFLQFVGRKSSRLASKIDHGKLIELNESELKVGFSKPIYLEMIGKDDVSVLEDMLSEHLRRKMKLIILPLLTQARAEKKMENSHPVHPVVEQALKVFGGKVIAENIDSN